jgi:predicted transcriptional regulator
LLDLSNNKNNKIYKYLSFNKGETAMRRSKLEIYADLLKALAHEGPLKLTHLVYKVNINCTTLKEDLDALIRLKLVEERTTGKNRGVFSVTERGFTILNYFCEISQVFLIINEADVKPHQDRHSDFSKSFPSKF